MPEKQANNGVSSDSNNEQLVVTTAGAHATTSSTANGYVPTAPNSPLALDFCVTLDFVPQKNRNGHLGYNAECLPVCRTFYVVIRPSDTLSDNVLSEVHALHRVPF